MAHETVHLAEYAARLRYDDLPPEVVQRAKDCITDTVAVIVQGSGLPWSRIVVRYAQKIGAGGTSHSSVSMVPASKLLPRHWPTARSPMPSNRII